jgi:AcrR family transcriptional regulator
MSAAIRVIAAQGLGAPTATIAKEAGVSNGSLFTYFETKADLLNQLYVGLKTEMGAAALDGLPIDGDIREQMLHVWTRAGRRPAPRSAGRSRISAYRTISPWRAIRLRAGRWLASQSLWSEAVKTARCAMLRWRSSSP